MVFLSISTLELTDQVEHLATDWEVSDTPNFEIIHLSSMQDEKNKNAIIFTETLDPNKEWYARARALLTTGYTQISNVHKFIPKTETGSNEEDDYPSRISVPLLKTSCIDPKDHDVTLFHIFADGFSVIGNSSHVSTSWWIEDIFGNVAWSSLYNKIYKSEIHVGDVILKPNMIYRVKAVFHSSTNDSSPIGTYTFHTNSGTDIDLFTYLDYVDPKKELDLVIGKLEGATTVNWEIWEYVKNGEYEYKEDKETDDAVVNDFVSQGNWGMLSAEQAPVDRGLCKNTHANNGQSCRGVIIPWSKLSTDKTYQKTYDKYLKYIKSIELFRDTLFLANNMLDRLLTNETPACGCEKCGTVYYRNKDGTVMAVPLMKQDKGITNFRVIPADKYEILNPYTSTDYEMSNEHINLVTDVSKPLELSLETGLELEIEAKSGITDVVWEIFEVSEVIEDVTPSTFGPVSTYTYQQELSKDPSYKPPSALETQPIKEILYKNLSWETDYPSKADIKIFTYGLSDTGTVKAIIPDFIKIEVIEGELQILKNDNVKKGWIYFLNPKDDLLTLGGVRTFNFKLLDAIYLDIPLTGRVEQIEGPKKFFLRYPVGEIVENEASTGTEDVYIRYTYDRGENLKTVGYVTYSALKEPTKWVNLTEDNTSFIELSVAYTDAYYSGKVKYIYGNQVWY